MEKQKIAENDIYNLLKMFKDHGHSFISGCDLSSVKDMLSSYTEDNFKPRISDDLDFIFRGKHKMGSPLTDYINMFVKDSYMNLTNMIMPFKIDMNEIDTTYMSVGIPEKNEHASDPIALICLSYLKYLSLHHDLYDLRDSLYAYCMLMQVHMNGWNVEDSLNEIIRIAESNLTKYDSQFEDYAKSNFGKDAGLKFRTNMNGFIKLVEEILTMYNAKMTDVQIMNLADFLNKDFPIENIGYSISANFYNQNHNNLIQKFSRWGLVRIYIKFAPIDYKNAYKINNLLKSTLQKYINHENIYYALFSKFCSNTSLYSLDERILNGYDTLAVEVPINDALAFKENFKYQF